MKMELIPKLALTLILSSTAIATDWELHCLGNYPSPIQCFRTPWEAYALDQTLIFSGPTDVYSNCCYLTSEFQVTVDPGNRIVQLGPNSGPAWCIDLYAPTCGITGTVGPLPGGDWLFITGYTAIPFRIRAPLADPNLTLLAPRLGEYVLADSTYTIKWTDSPGNGACAGSYLLSYSTDLGVNWLPVDTNSIDGACSYDWAIPLNANDECKLRIQDANDPAIYDTVEEIYIYDCNETIPGDLNADCYVDFRDYTLLVSNWPTGRDFRLLLQLAEQWCDCGNPYDPLCGY